MRMEIKNKTGLGCKTEVILDGKPLVNVIKFLTLESDADGMVEVKLTLRPSSVDVDLGNPIIETIHAVESSHK